MRGLGDSGLLTKWGRLVNISNSTCWTITLCKLPIIMGLVLLMVGGCAPSPAFKGYPGPELADDRLATIKDECGSKFLCWLDIWHLKNLGDSGPIYSRYRDGFRDRLSTVKLLPGTYLVSIRRFIGVGYGNRIHSGKVTVRAGDVYLVRARDHHGSASTPLGALWIEDEKTREVVLGNKKGR